LTSWSRRINPDEGVRKSVQLKFRITTKGQPGSRGDSNLRLLISPLTRYIHSSNKTDDNSNFESQDHLRCWWPKQSNSVRDLRNQPLVRIG